MAPQVAVLWDYESCKPPRGYKVDAIKNICAVAQLHGTICCFNLYYKPGFSEDNFTAFQGSSLPSNKINFVEYDENETANLVVKLSTDMLIFALDVPPPATIVLMSSVLALLSYPLSALRNKGYDTVLVGTNARSFILDSVLNWKNDILKHKSDREKQEQVIGGVATSKLEGRKSSLLHDGNFHRRIHHDPATERSYHEKLENMTFIRPSEITENWKHAKSQPSLPVSARAILYPYFQGSEEHSSFSAVSSPVTDNSRDPNSPNYMTSSDPRRFCTFPESIDRGSGKGENTNQQFVHVQKLLTPTDSLGISTSRLPQSANLNVPPEKMHCSHEHRRIYTAQTAPRHLSQDSTIDFPSFKPLITALVRLQERGEEQPLRSLLGKVFPKEDLPANVPNLSHYTKLAHQAGVVELGGKGGTSWISLVPGVEACC
ncbi:hypothetical protein J132_02743 [Termitomyces sp. J132]|nr:hypothetical protein H2248_009816 [Termitomyces sp. 'cryptogamus']KNZ75411.1 hypothetical protein J132_02743 [Termitomyces sp. J132]